MDCRNCGLHPEYNCCLNAYYLSDPAERGRDNVKGAVFLIESCAEAIAKPAFKSISYDKTTDNVTLVLHDRSIVLMTCNGWENGVEIEIKDLCDRILRLVKANIPQKLS